MIILTFCPQWYPFKFSYMIRIICTQMVSIIPDPNNLHTIIGFQVFDAISFNNDNPSQSIIDSTNYS